MADVPLYFRSLLEKIAEEQNFVNYDVNIEPISSGGANYTSKLYNVTITEGPDELNLFAKVAAIGEKMRTQAPRFYETERYAYTKLAKLYEKLEEENGILNNHKLVLPKFYGSNPNEFEETIVLENLVTAGYNAYDRFKSIDWPYARAAFEELAKMHALSFAYGEYYTEEFDEIVEMLKFEWQMDTGDMKEYIQKVAVRAIEAVREENRDKLKCFLETFNKDEFAVLFKACRRVALAHGDFRPSNLMHKERDDGKVDIKIVDLQTLQGGSPVTDLLYFIFTGSDEQFRAQYYDRLIDHYYTQLSAAMKRLHLDPEVVYSRENFDAEFQEKLPYGLTLAVFTLPVITVDTENAPQVNENLEIADFSVENTSALYVERLNGVVNDFVKWGILK